MVGTEVAQPRALEHLRRIPVWRVDAALAIAFVVAGLLTTNRDQAGYEPRDALAVALVLASTVPYVFRRRAPLAVYLVSIVAVATLFILDHDGGVLPMILLVGAYSVGAYCPLPQVLVAGGGTVAVFLVMLLSDAEGFDVGEFVTSVPVYVTALLLGWTMQSRRLRLDALEREQEEAAARAAADERLRIAQELHDVVAHSLGVIAVQAGVGMHVIDDDPAEAKRALEHISRTSRSSLAEIRRLLGLVRSGEASAAYQPTPGLGDLPRLVREVGGTGLTVDLQLDDGARDLPPGVELAAYRIVQEGLTNAVRHGHAEHATVRLGVHGGRLQVLVSDDGRGGDPSGRPGGHGLVGMRERVAVYGGSLDAGPMPDGGFRVDASIPFDTEAAP